MTTLGTRHKTSFGASQGKLIMPPGGLVGAGAAKKNAAYDIINNYKSLELPDNKLEGMGEDFAKWVDNVDIIKEYSGHNIKRENKMLVRLYRYEAPISSMLVSESGDSNIMGYKILPYIKVLKTSSICRYNEGDILEVSEEITKFRTSQTWLEWKVLKDSEGTEIPEPEKLVGMLTAWRENSVRTNPFRFSDDDAFTFIVSDMEVLAEVNYLKKS